MGYIYLYICYVICRLLHNFLLRERVCPFGFIKETWPLLYVAKVKLFCCIPRSSTWMFAIDSTSGCSIIGYRSHSLSLCLFLANFIETSNLHRLAQPTKNFFNKNKFRYFSFFFMLYIRLTCIEVNSLRIATYISVRQKIKHPAKHCSTLNYFNKRPREWAYNLWSSQKYFP